MHEDEFSLELCPGVEVIGDQRVKERVPWEISLNIVLLSQIELGEVRVRQSQVKLGQATMTNLLFTRLVTNNVHTPLRRVQQ